VLCAGRDVYVTDAAALTTVCEDAAHIAGAIREESVEEVEGGSKRSDRIAVVLGPKGPVAEAGLESESPGLSTKDLDTFFEQLAGEAREEKTTAPAA
jgi:hypothetical protein